MRYEMGGETGPIETRQSKRARVDRSIVGRSKSSLSRQRVDENRGSLVGEVEDWERLGREEMTRIGVTALGGLEVGGKGDCQR